MEAFSSLSTKIMDEYAQITRQEIKSGSDLTRREREVLEMLTGRSLCLPAKNREKGNQGRKSIG